MALKVIHFKKKLLELMLKYRLGLVSENTGMFAYL